MTARRIAAWPLAALLSLGMPAPARAQVSTTAEPIARPFPIRRSPADLDALTRMYNTSDWGALQRLVRDIICVARHDAAAPGVGDATEYGSCAGITPAPMGEHAVSDALDIRRHHVAVSWLGHDAFGKPQLLRIVAHESREAWHRLDLPGLAGDDRGGLSELFLSRSPQGRASSVYTSKREEDPVAAQVPGFVQGIAGPLFGLIGTLAGSLPSTGREVAREPQKPRITATVKRVGLPYRRATVRLQAIGREPVSTEAFAGSAAATASSLSFSDVPHAPCARDLASRLAHELPGVTVHAACSSASPDPEQCLREFDLVLTREYRQAVDRCEGGKPVKETLQALATVDRAFRELIEDGTATSVQLDVTFKNRPPTRFTFGAGSAVMVDAWQTRPRVDVRDGVLTGNPLPRVMTMAFVNWSPRGYDPDADRVSAAERFRLFAGAALTPDFGAAFGVNVLLVRGVGLTAGGALLFGKGAEESEIGAPPSRPADPFRLSVARSVFVGVSYNYK